MNEEPPFIAGTVNAWLDDDTDPPSIIVAIQRQNRQTWQWHRLTPAAAMQLADQLYLLTRGIEAP